MSQVFDERSLALAARAPRRRALPLLDDRWLHLGERPAHARRPRRAARSPWPTTATSPTPPSCATSSTAARRRRQRRGELAPRQHHRHRAGHGPARRRPRPHPRGRRARRAAAAARRLLLRLHGRAHAVRRARPAGHPPARPRPARARLGGRSARPRRSTSSAPRWSARSSRASSSPSTRTACARSGSPRPTPQGLRLRVRLPRPPRHDDQRPGACTRPASRWAARLAREHPVEADLVIPTPESGTPAAIGYAQESGIPYGQGLVKNSYVGRTFIQPRRRRIRQLGIRLKLNPLRDVIRGKRLVVVDDSIVRGNTQRALVRMLREAGAAEVHVRISLAAGDVAVLLRHRLRDPGRADRHRPRGRGDRAPRSAPTRSATSREEGMIAATEQPATQLCTACFTGHYPVELPATTGSASSCFETLPIDARRGSLGVPGGTESALDRPERRRRDRPGPPVSETRYGHCTGHLCRRRGRRRGR